MCVVKGQSDAVQVQRHRITVERTTGAARDGRACGRQQAIVGFIGARDAGRGQELGGADLLVHRRDDWLRWQGVITRQTCHCVASSAVFQAHTATSDCTKSSCTIGADAARTGVGIVKPQADAAHIQRHCIAVECAAGAAQDTGAGGSDQAVVAFVHRCDAGRSRELFGRDGDGRRARVQHRQLVIERQAARAVAGVDQAQCGNVFLRRAHMGVVAACQAVGESFDSHAGVQGDRALVQRQQAVIGFAG